MPSSRPVASVVICTYNRAGWLDATLRSLSRVVTDQQWEIVVVDNNSQDDTPAVVARHKAESAVPVTYLFEPRQGKSNALNTGMARAGGDILVFTDLMNAGSTGGDGHYVKTSGFLTGMVTSTSTGSSGRACSGSSPRP